MNSLRCPPVILLSSVNLVIPSLWYTLGYVFLLSTTVVDVDRYTQVSILEVDFQKPITLLKEVTQQRQPCHLEVVILNLLIQLLHGEYWEIGPIFLWAQKDVTHKLSVCSCTWLIVPFSSISCTALSKIIDSSGENLGANLLHGSGRPSLRLLLASLRIDA